MNATWFVLEDGSAADPREVVPDANGILRHKDGRAVAYAPHGPRSRSVDPEKERAKMDEPAKAAAAAKAAEQAKAQEAARVAEEAKAAEAAKAAEQAKAAEAARAAEEAKAAERAKAAEAAKRRDMQAQQPATPYRTREVKPE